MITDPIFFRDLAMVLVAAVLGAAVAWLTRQPLILGYVLGGIVISPLTPGPSVSDIRTFELFAEIGVVLLMFSIGIEFSLRDLLKARWVALVGGPLGIALSVLLSLGVGLLLGWPVLQSAIVGIVVSVASTMVLARLLMDRGELNAPHGRIMIAITLVEDLAVVMLIVLIPALGEQAARRLVAIGQALGIGLAILIPFFYLAAKVVPPLLTRVAQTRSQELFLLVTLALGIGTAAVTHAAGLSLALGAFLAGLIVNESDYAHETLSRLLPLRDTFVALFFVTIGALVNPAAVLDNLPLLAVIVALVVIGKLVIWTFVVWLFRFPLRTAFLVGVGLTQIGEFSFILVQVARASGLIGDEVYNATLAASLLTILINAALVRYMPRLIGATDLTAPTPVGDERASAAGDHVLLCGFGRVGGAVASALETFEAPYVAIDTSPDVVRGLRSRGIASLLGDASRRRVLERAGAGRAALAVVAISEIEPATRAVRALRAINPRVPILARAQDPASRDKLLAAGASEVIQPEIEAASALVGHSLRYLSLPSQQVLAYLERLRGAMHARPAVGAPTPEPLPEIRELLLPDGGLDGQSLRGARVRERFGVTIVAIIRRDGSALLHPSPETLFRAGDRVRLFGLREQIDSFMLASQSRS